MQIKIIIKTQRLTLSSNKIVCGTNNFIECLFDFSLLTGPNLKNGHYLRMGKIPMKCISKITNVSFLSNAFLIKAKLLCLLLDETTVRI